MKCEEITISRENIQEIFKKISQYLKANPDTHIFLSENIVLHLTHKCLLDYCANRGYSYKISGRIQLKR